MIVLLIGVTAHADDKHTLAVLGVVPKDAGLTKAAFKLLPAPSAPRRRRRRASTA